MVFIEEKNRCFNKKQFNFLKKIETFNIKNGRKSMFVFLN